MDLGLKNGNKKVGQWPTVFYSTALLLSIYAHH